MLSLKANKKLLQNHLMQDTGKVVLLRDLHNIAAQQRPSQKNDFAELVGQMKKTPGNHDFTFKHDYELGTTCNRCHSGSGI